MPSDYEAITKYNEEMLGKDTASRKSQILMYSDFSHFVYEILQNADDYGATEIEFRLLPNQLIIEHNGIPFRTEHVKAISYFEKSTSREDLIKTGHFGLGFKSVFAFTATPFIFSGDESFEIYGLYRLKREAMPIDLPEGHTRIVLPFNHSDVHPDYIETYISADSAFEKISVRLKKLEMISLLFTHNLKKIEWQIGNERGQYFRNDDEVDEYSASLKKTTISNDSESQSYYVFTRPISWRDGPRSEKKNYKPVEVAFRIGPKGIENQPKKHLVVLFETKIETKMGFLINGPYRTTPNRETVKEEDEFNQHLIQNTAVLVTEALLKLQDMSLISVPLLEALPIRSDDFPEDSIFRPIFDTVRDALLSKPLLPAYGEDDEQSSALPTFTSGREAKLAGFSELRKLLSGKQLADLYDTSGNLSWINRDVTANKTSTLGEYLRKELKIDELDAEAFVRRVDEKFLANQTDEWLVSFYGFLQGQQAWFKNLERRRGSKQTWPEVPFFKKPIIRLGDGRHIAPFSDEYGQVPAAFLPGAEKNGLPTIKSTIAEKKEAREFLKALGFDVPDIVDMVIERILPKYASSTSEIPPSYQTDFGAILDALKTDSEAKKKRLREKLARASWVLAENTISGQKTLRKPGEVYFRSQELEIYFAGNSLMWFLSRELDEFKNALEELGVSKLVRVSHRSPDRSGNVSIPSKHRNWYTRGLKGFDPDAKIDGLDFALANPTTEKSLFIWNCLLLPHKYLIKGSVEAATRSDYNPSTKEEKLSEPGRIAIRGNWLPSLNDRFYKPSDLRLDDLPEEFERDEELTKALGMKLLLPEATVRALAEAVGVGMEELDYLRDNREAFGEFKKWKESQHQQLNNNHPAFPARPVINPERREEKVIEQLENAPDKTREEKNRSVRTSTESIDQDVWLRSRYTNDADQLVCQICQEEMPFRKRNREYYFEAVEALSKDHCSKEYEALFLALCPVCAAMYKEFVKRDESVMIRFKQALINSHDSSQIPIQLGERTASIRFVETHLHDLRLILRELGQVAASELS